MSGDQRRLEQLAATHSARVLAYLARRRNDPADTADVFQSVLVIAWRKLAEVPDDDRAALVWMLATARRCLANERRGHVRRLDATERLRATIRLDPPDPIDTPSDISRALMELTDADRELITLVYWDDLTIEEAAAIVDITAPAARKRLQRARARLRSHLETSRVDATCEPQ